MWWMRASGLARPSAFRPRSLTTITPLAPSQIWLALAAVMTPPSCSSFTPPMPSSDGVEADALVDAVQLVVVALPSARRTGTGTISSAKRPACVAAIARWWLCSA